MVTRLNGVDVNSPISFKTCLENNIVRVPRKKANASNRNKREALDLLHSDVCVPVHVPSGGEAIYFVTPSDDASALSVVFFEEKDETAGN